eukprot:2340035-Pleurochrysis_carterae.AAC.1
MRSVRAIDFGYCSLNFFFAVASFPSYTSNHDKMLDSPQHNVCSSKPISVGLRATTIKPGMPRPSQCTTDSCSASIYEQIIAL